MPAAQTSATAAAPDQLSNPSLKRIALGLLLLGLVWRIVRYLLRFPIWGDECMLGMNLVWFDYRELMDRLENCQIAPLFFLWGERLAFSWLGPGELSMRLLPFLAGTGSLLFYWRLTGLMLGARSRLFAIGFLAVAIWPVSMCTLLKPYSLDLMMSLMLLLPAVRWLKTPERTAPLAWLILLMPVAMLSSYPTAFVAGGISLALLLPAWRQGWKARFLFAAFNLTLLAGFFIAYRIGVNQLSTPVGLANTQAAMTEYWENAFPPASPLAFPLWFLKQTAGQMTAYPVGASNGGSAATVLFCIAGGVALTRRKRWQWLVLLTAPVALGLLASIIRKYPYGASGRLTQHLAPGICILAGLGLAAVINRTSHVKRWTLVATAVFALIGLGGLTKDVLWPYRDIGCEWTRSTTRKIQKELPPGEPLVICDTPQTMRNGVFTWYWLIDRERPVSWNFTLPPRSLNVKQLCGFHQGPQLAEEACNQLSTKLKQQNPAWRLVERKTYYFKPSKKKLIPDQCDLFFFSRAE